VPSEIQNIIESQGVVLSNADLNQLGKALAGYIANGHFYTDSGIANAYVLSTIGSKQNAPSLTDGFTASFIPGNDSTGASTANVGGFGVKDIKRPDGTAVQAGDIADRATLVYDDSAGYFVLFGFVPDSSTTSKGIIETATSAEVITGTDTIRAVTPAGIQAKVASTTAKGISELATSAETITGTDTARVVTPAGLQAKVASTTQKGIVEEATAAEIYAATAAKFISALGLVTSLNDNYALTSTTIIQELPNGLIFQGGRRSGEGAVTFVEAFTTAPEVLLGQIERASASGISDLNLNFSAPSTTGFTSYIVGGDFPHWWFAIGK